MDEYFVEITTPGQPVVVLSVPTLDCVRVAPIQGMDPQPLGWLTTSVGRWVAFSPEGALSFIAFRAPR